jgi:hypothetical protein
MYTKTMSVDTEWLSQIDGLTVDLAIKYLRTLDQTHKLDCYIAGGDTSGCDLVSRLCYDVPMTNSEILTTLENKYNKEIALYEKARQSHILSNSTTRIENCDRLLSILNIKLEEARNKYSK